MNTIFFVYLLTFANGKVYVGMSKTDARGRNDNRYRQHASEAKKGKQNPVYNAWRKHGAPVQSLVSMHDTRAECALAEIDAIQQFDSMNPAKGYNLMAGGQGLHAPVGSAVYELMRVKVWSNPERSRKLSEAFKGKPLVEAARIAQMAWRNSPEGRAATRDNSRGAAARAKMVEDNRRRLLNPEYRKRLSEVQKGRPPSWNPEKYAEGRERHREWLDSDEGRAAVQKGFQAMRANPDNETKRKAAHAVYAASDANKAHCAAMSKAARKPVKDLATGEIFDSQKAAAAAHGVTGPTIGYWIKRGKFAYV